MGAKKINSTKVDEYGKVIKANLAEWKKANPGALIFDSRLEWGCWMKLRESGLAFMLKPPALELIPSQVVRDLLHTKDVAKALSRDRRDAVCKADKSMYKRLANKNNNKVLRDVVVRPLTWSPDFYLPGERMYIEVKGFANDAFPVKLKLAQNLFHGQEEFIVVYTLKDMHDLMLFLKK